LIELVPEVIPHISNPEDPLIVQVELAAYVGVRLPGEVGFNKVANGFRRVQNLGRDLMELAVISAAVVAEVIGVGVNAPLLPSVKLGNQSIQFTETLLAPGLLHKGHEIDRYLEGCCVRRTKADAAHARESGKDWVGRQPRAYTLRRRGNCTAPA
jgi:hypothetical protein